MSISCRKGKQHLWYWAAAVAVLAPSYWLGWIMSSSGDAGDASDGSDGSSEPTRCYSRRFRWLFRGWRSWFPSTR